MDEFQSTQLVNSRLPRRTYLVTYSQVDLTKLPTRKGFGKCIKKHFNSGSGKVKVQHWACAKEKHQNGGIHYHVALKLIDLRRWRSVKEIMSLKEGIVVNFSDNLFSDNFLTFVKQADQIWQQEIGNKPNKRIFGGRSRAKHPKKNL